MLCERISQYVNKSIMNVWGSAKGESRKAVWNLKCIKLIQKLSNFKKVCIHFETINTSQDT